MGHALWDVCYLVLGLLLLIIPDTVLPWLCLGCGVAVLLMGVFHLVSSFRQETRGIATYCQLAGGAVAAALGVYALLRPQSVQFVLPVLFGLLIAVDGVARIDTAFRVARGFVPRWGLQVLLGLASFVLGVALALHGHIPGVKTLDAIFLSGILLVVEGVLDLGCTLYLGGARAAGARAARTAPAPEAQPAVPDPPAPVPPPEAVPAAAAEPELSPESAAPAPAGPDGAPDAPAEENAAHEI